MNQRTNSSFCSAGRTTTNEELEDMLEQGNPAVFTQVSILSSVKNSNRQLGNQNTNNFHTSDFRFFNNFNLTLSKIEYRHNVTLRDNVILPENASLRRALYFLTHIIGRARNNPPTV